MAKGGVRLLGGRTLPVPPPSEVALAAVTSIAMAADVGQAARPWLALVLVLVSGATLAWRLQVPWLPLALICGVNLLLEATAPGEFPPQTLVFGLLVAIYSAAAHLQGRVAVIAAIGSLVAVWCAHVLSPDGDAADFLPFVIWAAPWLAGRLVRRQTTQAREAGARAAIAEVQARDAARHERDRIARELHDVVAHSVSLMVVQAGAERMALSDGSARTRTALGAIEDAGRQALVELRAMLGLLRAPGEEDERAPQPDLTAVPALVEQVISAGLPVDLDMRGDRAVPPGVALAAYRVVQESLTNTLRHAGPVPTSVLVAVDDSLVVEVANPIGGNGDGHRLGSGRGLTGMRERVEMHGGVLTAGRDGDRWLVRAQLPLTDSGSSA